MLVDRHFALELEPGLGERGVAFGQQGLVLVQALGRLAGGQPAGGAGGDVLLAGIVLLGERDVARREGETGQVLALSVVQVRDRGWAISSVSGARWTQKRIIAHGSAKGPSTVES